MKKLLTDWVSDKNSRALAIREYRYCAACYAAKEPRKQDGLWMVGGRRDGQSDGGFSVADELVYPESLPHDDELVKREGICTGGCFRCM